jgi:hypothetical protein
MKHFVDGAEGPLPGWQGFQGHPTGQTLDKMSMAAKKEAILAVEREPLVGLRSGLRQVQQ